MARQALGGRGSQRCLETQVPGDCSLLWPESQFQTMQQLPKTYPGRSRSVANVLAVSSGSVNSGVPPPKHRHTEQRPFCFQQRPCSKLLSESSRSGQQPLEQIFPRWVGTKGPDPPGSCLHSDLPEPPSALLKAPSLPRPFPKSIPTSP